MYELLSDEELARLQRMLFHGTEEAFRVASCQRGDPRWTEQCCGAHQEIATLFIEAGTELVTRLRRELAAAA